MAERGLVAGDRLDDGIELLALHVPELAKDVRFLAGVVVAGGSAREELGELGPHARAAEERGERPRALVGLAERGLDVAPGLDGLVARFELLAQDGGDAHAVRALQLRGGRVGAGRRRAPIELAAPCEDVDERTPATRLFEEDDEAVERLGIGRHRLESSFPGPDRAVVLLELGRETRGLAEHLRADLRLLFEDRETLEHVEPVVLASHLCEQRLDVPACGEERLVRDRRAAQYAEK